MTHDTEPKTARDVLGALLDATEPERAALLSEHPEAAGVVLDLARDHLAVAEARDTGGEPR